MDRFDGDHLDCEHAVRDCVERGIRLRADIDARWSRNQSATRAEIANLIEDAKALLPGTEIFQALTAIAASRLTLGQPRQAVNTILRAARKHARDAPRARRT